MHESVDGKAIASDISEKFANFTGLTEAEVLLAMVQSKLNADCGGPDYFALGLIDCVLSWYANGDSTDRGEFDAIMEEAIDYATKKHGGFKQVVEPGHGHCHQQPPEHPE